MEDLRTEKRKPLEGVGFFDQDGQVGKIRLLDSCAGGLGVYAETEYRPGLQGLVLTGTIETGGKSYAPAEVCWCLADPMAEDSRYPFRAGLRLLGE